MSMKQLSLSDVRQQFNIPLSRLPKIRSGTTVIWIEDSNSLLSSMKDAESVRLLDNSNQCNILRYTNLSKWMKYMKQARSYERMIVVLIMKDCDNIDINRINQYEQVKSILIICRCNKSNEIEFFEKKKISGIYTDYRLASLDLQRLIDENEELDDGFLTTLNQKEKSLRNIREDFIEFLCTHSYRVILMSMDYKSFESKREMLAEIRAFYRNKVEPSAEIKRFSENYNSYDAINWYKRSSFLYHIVNKALRTEDIRALYIFRYFIMDVSLCLKSMSRDTRNRFNKPFSCYRGSKMSREEVKQLRINTLVATNGFWSSSRDICVANIFAGIDLTNGMSPSRSLKDKRQHLLFQIDIDFSRSPHLIVADVSGLSAFKDENEMLFDLSTAFIITDKRYDNKHHVWHIRMTSTSEIDLLDKDYNLYVHQRLSLTNGTMLYGNLLVGALCDYREAMIYFQRLLRILPINDENRPNIYSQLGRVYRFMGKYEQAIEYYRIALLLQRRNLPQSKFDYGATLSGLGVVYSEMGDLKGAIYFHRRALTIYRTLFPDGHLEINQILDRLAYDLYQNGQYENAFHLLSNRNTLIKENIYLINPQTQLFHTLGLLYKTFGNRTQSIQYLKQALILREKWSHKHHPYTARICYELSLLYAQQDHQRIIALKYAQRALTIRQARISPNQIELKQSIQLVQRLSLSNYTTIFK